MRSNQQTASSCPNGEYSLLNFAQPNKIGNISSDSQMSMTWKRVLLPFSETVHEVFNPNVIQTVRFSRKVFFLYIKMNTVLFYTAGSHLVMAFTSR